MEKNNPGSKFSDLSDDIQVTPNKYCLYGTVTFYFVIFFSLAVIDTGK